MSVKNDKHQRYISQYEWDLDIKPKGKYKRQVHKKARAKLKQELHHEAKNMEAVREQDAELEWEERMDKEADEALWCHYYGPCEKCLERELKERADREIDEFLKENAELMDKLAELEKNESKD